MRMIIAVVAALALASCGAKDLRTKEEAATAAAVEAVQTQQEAVDEAVDEAAESSAVLTVATDALTGCQYLLTSSGAITPRVRYISGNTYSIKYEHIGCNKS